MNHFVYKQPENQDTSSRGVVVITSVSHIEGSLFEPGREQLFTFWDQISDKFFSFAVINMYNF